MQGLRRAGTCSAPVFLLLLFLSLAALRFLVPWVSSVRHAALRGGQRHRGGGRGGEGAEGDRPQLREAENAPGSCENHEVLLWAWLKIRRSEGL